jgi:hypothetical protein
MKAAYLVGAALTLSVAVGLYALRQAADDNHAPTPRRSLETSVEAPAPEPRPEPREAPVAVAPAAETAPAGEPDDGVLNIDLTGNASFFALFDELGLQDMEERLAQWGLQRGYPQLDDQGNPLLDQPYEQYDDDTLRAFADGDDMWAQQILAKRLADTRPAEALEWYRKAAVNGSVYAMTEMARLYRDLAYSRSDTALEQDGTGLEQEYALRDGPDSLAAIGYAWAAVAEEAGWDPLRGGMTASFVGAKLSDTQKKAACGYASSLFSDLVSARDERGLGDYDRRPPPVVFDPGTVGGTNCAEDPVPRYEAQCQEVQVNVGDQVSRLWTCDDGQGP